MKLKILQLNIEGGRKLDDVISYWKREQFDILQLQEVAGGSLSRAGIDTWEALQNELGYRGELVPYIRLRNTPQSYSGIATLFHPTFKVDEKNIFWLREFYELSSFDRTNVALIKNLPRCVLALRFLFEQRPLWCINTHLAWGPTPVDEPYKIEQGQKLISFIKSLKEPFVLSGDFNVTSDSQIVAELEKLGVNHARNHGITNTLNPTLHRAQELFPEGLGVDFLFTSPNLQASGFSLINTPDLSDHYGLRITVEG
jgi:endonuclease/exonuclease/phosphatase family metal-dependent hydrolase